MVNIPGTTIVEVIKVLIKFSVIKKAPSVDEITNLTLKNFNANIIE